MSADLLARLLVLAALVAAGLAIGLVVITVRGWLAASAAAEDVRRQLLRRAAWREEATRLLALRSPLADSAQRAADAVDLGATVTRLGHETVAGLSFALLDAIPATRGRTTRFRRRHDEIAGRFYSAINDATTTARRAGRALTGDEE
ncbi:hypothetical protein [Nocardioides sp. Kera G14]|uniref:hypothetical protein n=1 Tax=Nocardioides sp. Kera G14 TaxID=2884264 RepID=UPI001D0FF8A7|nr:hypothetical protein [Nocardioides sp. Kera G14]UDY22347.1 hypothetical protein LH076_09660 [Nocardioides sp. Kera G14]